MKIGYEEIKREIVDYLKNNKVGVLSTAYNGHVTSRSMSIINKELDIYFQTNKCYVKYSQIKDNKQVALCIGNMSIEGIAEEIGTWKDAKNKEILDLYKSVHLGSYEAYGLLEGQVVIKVKPNMIKMWKYIDKKPVIQYVDIHNKEVDMTYEPILNI